MKKWQNGRKKRKEKRAERKRSGHRKEERLRAAV